AENLALYGWKVTRVEQAPHVLPTCDLEMARYVEAELTNTGIEVITGQSVTAFHEIGQVLELTNGQSLSSDVTILSVG
ncbi:FAD-dependent oxidoreductase, partial [Streptococcus suis]